MYNVPKLNTKTDAVFSKFKGINFNYFEYRICTFYFLFIVLRLNIYIRKVSYFLIFLKKKLHKKHYKFLRFIPRLKLYSL